MLLEFHRRETPRMAVEGKISIEDLKVSSRVSMRESGLVEEEFSESGTRRR